jgi:uncharacterized SAM-binding protein YcdF (DUF218 family)
MTTALELGRILWDYLQIGALLEKRDAILVFGGHDLRVAEWAAELWLQGWASLLVCSGGAGYYTSKIWDEPEAHKFRRIAIDRGVRRDAILVENRSAHSGQNVTFTRRLLDEAGVSLRRAICVQKPYLERRVLATLRKQWTECDFLLSSPDIPYGEYPRPDIIELDKLLNEMVGQVDRLEKYPALGFTVPVDVPEDVLIAKSRLIELGFADHLVESG